MVHTIRLCEPGDVPAMHHIVNAAAAAYRGVIPADCYHEPYMSLEAMQADIAAGVEFWGCESGGRLLGIMGTQSVREVDLIRHAYVLPEHQGEGIGAMLLKHLISGSERQLLVGTWADARWAIRFYERHGFALVSAEATRELLNRYWKISDRQAQTSVVLELGRPPRAREVVT